MSARARQDGSGTSRPPRRWLWLCAFTAALGLLGLAAASLARSAMRHAWVASALTSRFSIICAVVLIGCAVLAGGLCWSLWRIGRRARPAGTDGTAMIEFALVLPVLLGLVLMMIQVSMLLGGNLCVHYAAYAAARAAVVQVPMNLSPPGGEPANVVWPEGASAKLDRITDAAVWAVMPVSNGRRGGDEADATTLISGLERFFDDYGQARPAWLDERLARKFHYARDHTYVKLEAPLSGTAYGPHEDLKIVVEHDLHLAVPLAAKVFASLSGVDGVTLGDGEYAVRVKAYCMLTNEGEQNYIDIETWP